MGVAERPHETSLITDDAGLAQVTQTRKSPITARAVLIGLLFMAPNAYWIVMMEVRWQLLDGTCLPLFVTPVFTLLLVSGLNAVLSKLAPRARLTAAELVTIYVMQVVVCCFTGHDTIANLIGTIAHKVRNTTLDNRWDDLFAGLFPDWMWVNNKELVDEFYQGTSDSLFAPQIVSLWQKPLLIWCGFFAMFCATLLSMAAVLRRSWIEHDRLSFPIVQLPLGITAPGKQTVLSDPLFWTAFGMAAVVSLMNGLNLFYPAVPSFPRVKITDIGRYFQNPPMNALGGTQISAYPFAVGLAYFLPTDLSFSCWFFFLLRKTQQVWRAASGRWTQDYFGEQSAGAWLFLIVAMLWASRKQLRRLSARVLQEESAREPREMAWRKVCGCLVILGFCGMVAFARAAGMSLELAVPFFLLTVGLGIALSRVRAEMGSPHEIYFVQPRDILVTVMGTRAIGKRNLAGMSSFYWLNRGNRNHPMPNYLEAFKLAQATGISGGSMLKLLAFSSAVALVLGVLTNLHVPYIYGGASKTLYFKSWVGAETFNKLQDWLVNAQPPNKGGIEALTGGAIVAGVLSALRLRFAGFPFHPAGYALATSFALDYFWFPFFLGWFAKAVILRWGGQAAHRRMVPFFLGLVAGDYTMGALWTLWGICRGVQTYRMYI